MNALIVSSHPVTWLGLSAILYDFGSVNTVEMCSKDDFIFDMQNNPLPDIIFFDVVKCDINSIMKLKRCVNYLGQSKLFVFTDNESGEMAAPIIKMGIDAYVLKEESHQKILEAISAVMEGHFWISDKVKANIDESQDVHHKNESSLTEREAEVLSYLAQGMINKEIARKMCLSCRTVETYITQLSRKFSVRNRVEVVLKALVSGFIDINDVHI